MHVVYVAFIVDEKSETVARAKLKAWLGEDGESPLIVSSLAASTPITESHVIRLYGEVLRHYRPRDEEPVE